MRDMGGAVAVGRDVGARLGSGVSPGGSVVCASAPPGRPDESGKLQPASSPKHNHTIRLLLAFTGGLYLWRVGWSRCFVVWR